MSAPSPFACHRGAETNASKAIWANQFVNHGQVIEVGAGGRATSKTIFDNESTTIGERVIRSLLLPTAINKSAPNEVLTHYYEWSAPDHAKPLKGFIRPIGLEIPYTRRAEKPKNCESAP